MQDAEAPLYVCRAGGHDARRLAFYQTAHLPAMSGHIAVDDCRRPVAVGKHSPLALTPRGLKRNGP
jgi:hypothetical protein